MIDLLIEKFFFVSFSRLGYVLRARAARFSPIESYDLHGRVVLVTGATSGIGLGIATASARLGATVLLLGRDAGRLDSAASTVRAAAPQAAIDCVVADMSEPESVRQAAITILERHETVDTVVHNAGALTADRSVNSQGVEATVAGQVVGPFLLTALLLERLQESAPARVLTMSSGGMYTAPLDVEHLEMNDDYRGAKQYARAKRAQVTLTELWTERFPDSGVVFHSLHPGWVDTPGLRHALPTFGRVLGPLLRSTAEGIDTAMWLIADETALASSGGFWHDRQARPTHRMAMTRRADTTTERVRLWDWCVERAGVDPVNRCS